MQASKFVDFNIKLLLLVPWLGSVTVGVPAFQNVKQNMPGKLVHDNEHARIQELLPEGVQL